MVGYAVCEVLNKSFYALSDGKTPMITSIIGIAVNFIAAALLVGVLHRGVGGLALASAISSLAIAACLLIMINKRRSGVITKGFMINVVKILICGAVAFAVARVIDIFASEIGGGTLLTLVRLCVCALPAVVVYVVMAYVIKVDEIRQAVRFLMK